MSERKDQQLPQIDPEDDNNSRPDPRNSTNDETDFQRYGFTLLMLGITQMLLMADSSLMGPTLTKIALEFRMDEEQRDKYLGGYIPFGYFLVGGTISLWVGSLADTRNRIKLFFVIVLLGEIPGILITFVDSFWQLFLLRICPGISVGGALPIVLSVLSDIFPQSQRGYATGVVFLLTQSGLGLGEIISGEVAIQYGWRAPFAVVAVPAIVCGCLVRAYGVEPPRKLQQEEGHGAPTCSNRKLKAAFSIKTNWFVLAQGIPGCLPWGTIWTFLADDLQDRGLSMTSAAGLMSIFSAGTAFGTLAGGTLGQLLYNSKKERMAHLMGISTILGVGPLMYLINRDYHTSDGREGGLDILSAVVAFCGGFVATMTGPNTRAVLMNVNPPDNQGFVFGLCTIADDLGRGLGPPIVSALILLTNRSTAFNISALGWLGCGGLLLLAAFTLRGDEERALQRVQEAQKHRSTSYHEIFVANISDETGNSINAETPQNTDGERDTIKTNFNFFPRFQSHFQRKDNEKYVSLENHENSLRNSPPSCPK
mmetsp:Transcript_73/g.106  ORF Transcript_73/g.106 Transcript_73/m.106 type:complete len:538 (-) Transcript_73:122-1735(-)